jgi:hydroxyacid-oxoacid transhydrogenase
VALQVGYDLASLGVKKAFVVTDKNISSIPGGPLQTALASLHKCGVAYTVFENVSIEPTDSSFKTAIAAAKAASPDAFVAVGGGSVMDTAKAANLYYSHPSADFLDYVNAPVGKGLPVPGAVKPLIAIPTTAGTGSETTGVAIFDYTPMHAKTGIASRLLKPTLGIVDPNNTQSMPPDVAAASGFDVLCHALESYTAIPFNERTPRPASPTLRPAYQGANPISDVWSLHSLRLLAKYFISSVKDRSDEDANAAMTLAATYAGVGFGNAGVHLCHGMSYAISGNNKEYTHPGYAKDKPLVPHGISVVIPAPAIFRFTGPTNPARHLEAARVLRGDNPPVHIHMYRGDKETVHKSDEAKAHDAGKYLSDQLLRYMDTMRVPNGISALGYSKADIPALVEGTLPQRRVLNLAPVGGSQSELTKLFEESMQVY